MPQPSSQPSTEPRFDAAVRCFQANQLAEAESLCRAMLEANPDNAPAMNLLGQIALKVKKPKLAAELFQHACEFSPNEPAAYFNLGQAHGELKQYRDAANAYRRALELAPDMAIARIGLGTMLGRYGKHEEAVKVLSEGGESSPKAGQIAYCRGWSLKELGRWPEAEAAFARAVELEPNNGLSHYALASTRARMGDSAGSLEAVTRAIALDPTQLEWQCDYAVALRQLGRVDEALAHARQLVRAHPSLPSAHGLLGILLLLTGAWTEGWSDYEWRWKCGSFTTRWRKFREPLWDGGELNGRRILLWPEQGRGDVIQFVRYAPLVAKRGGRVIVSAPPDLIGLLKKMEGVEMAVADTGAIPPFDVHLPLLSLPRIFNTTPDTIPNHVPYLWPDPQHLEKWRQRIVTDAKQRDNATNMRVGVAWAGAPKHVDDASRSMNLANFAPLAAIPNVEFYSLQKGPRSKDARPPGLHLIDHTSDLHTYADTAALIAQLDLIISVDTSVCHLAGAMGKPVWTLLAFAPDWRWLLNREDTPWYPTMRLFRQKSLRDWPGVIERVVVALKELRDTKTLSREGNREEIHLATDEHG